VAVNLDAVPQERLAAPADGHEARALLDSWLRQLPCRQALVMRLDVDGWSVPAIAGILGLARNTVRTYKQEARQRLRELVEASGLDAPEARRRG